MKKQSRSNTAQEEVHQVMPKKDARKLTGTPTARKAATPPGAAKGDDDRMNQPAKRS